MAHVIAFSGFIGSGKSAAAAYLIDRYNYRSVSFAAALKKATAELFGWPYEQLRGLTDDSRAWRELPDPYWSKVFGHDVTPRWALQFVGTDLVRNHLHKDFWAAHTEKTILDTLAAGQSVVIDDMRFVNEIAMTEKLSGLRVWVIRGQITDYPVPIQRLVETTDPAVIADNFIVYKTMVNAHPSEVDWLTNGRNSFDMIIRNDKDMPAFLTLVDRLHHQMTVWHTPIQENI